MKAVQPNQLEDSDPGFVGGGEDDGRAGKDRLPQALWLVLGLVIERPSHGYELAQRYERRFGGLLALSTPRVYGALDRLKGLGMIEQIALGGDGRGRKQHGLRRSFRATRLGAESYRRWVAERIRDDPQRARLLSRIVSTGLLGVDAVLDVLDRCERDCLQELMALPGDSAVLESGDCGLEELLEALVVDEQRRELRARRDWAVHARRALLAHRQLKVGEGS